MEMLWVPYVGQEIETQVFKPKLPPLNQFVLNFHSGVAEINDWDNNEYIVCFFCVKSP